MGGLHRRSCSRNRTAQTPRLALRVGLLTLIATAMLGLVSGCGKEESDNGTSAATTPVRGGTLTVAYQGEPATLDPALDWDDGWNILYSVASGLLKYSSGSGEAGTKLEGDLAVEVPEPTDGGTVYTFRLRDGLRFSPPNGRQITAADLKWSFERMMSLPTAPGTYLYSSIKGADEFVNGTARHVSGYQVVDNQTVRIVLRSPDPTILYTLAMPFACVVPKEAVESAGKQFGQRPVSAGPFLVKSWVRGQRITLERNPNYWDADNVYLDGVVVELGVSPSTAVLRVQRGDLDITGDTLPSADLARLQSDPEWQRYVGAESFLNITYLYMNVHMEPFDDVRVRRAVASAIDREKLAKLFMGGATTLDNIYPEGLSAAGLSPAFPANDPEAARRLLSESGDDAPRITIHARNTEPFPRLLQSIQYDLKQVGIDARVQLHPESTYWTLMGKPHEMEIGLCDWYMDFPDPSNIIKPLLSKASAKGGGFNASFWWNPKVERLVQEADTMSDDAARDRIYGKIAAIVHDEVPIVPLVQVLRTSLHDKDVGGFYVTPRGTLYLADYWKTNGK